MKVFGKDGHFTTDLSWVRCEAVPAYRGYAVKNFSKVGRFTTDLSWVRCESFRQRWTLRYRLIVGTLWKFSAKINFPLTTWLTFCCPSLLSCSPPCLHTRQQQAVGFYAGRMFISSCNRNRIYWLDFWVHCDLRSGYLRLCHHTPCLIISDRYKSPVT